MSEQSEKSQDGVLARTEHRAPALRREGVIAIGATAVGALALGAVAVGALAIGKLAIGQLALGRAKVRRGQVDHLEIARLTIRELTMSASVKPTWRPMLLASLRIARRTPSAARPPRAGDPIAMFRLHRVLSPTRWNRTLRHGCGQCIGPDRKDAGSAEADRRHLCRHGWLQPSHRVGRCRNALTTAGLRREVIDPAIEEHGGNIVQTGGDSLLIVFDSIDGAVRCAVKVQQQVPIHDGDQPPDRAIRFRVGINIGDAIADGTDLHGDAVNVAARLQAECPPGGICVTRAVRDHMRGRSDLTFEELGVLSLKNIAHPVEAFVLKLNEDPFKPAPIERSPVAVTRGHSRYRANPQSLYWRSPT